MGLIRAGLGRAGPGWTGLVVLDLVDEAGECRGGQVGADSMGRQPGGRGQLVEGRTGGAGGRDAGQDQSDPGTQRAAVEQGVRAHLDPSPEARRVMINGLF